MVANRVDFDDELCS